MQMDLAGAPIAEQVSKNEEKNKKQRAKAASKEEKTIEHLAEAIAKAEIPSLAIPSFTKIWLQIHAETAWVKQNYKIMFNGAPRHRFRMVYAGPGVTRMAKFVAKFCPLDPVPGMTEFLKDFSKGGTIPKELFEKHWKLDGDFMQSVNWEACSENIIVRDLYLCNLCNIKKELPKCMLPEDWVVWKKLFSNTPYKRITPVGWTWLSGHLQMMCKAYVELMMGISIKELYFGPRPKADIVSREYYVTDIDDEMHKAKVSEKGSPILSNDNMVSDFHYLRTQEALIDECL